MKKKILFALIMGIITTGLISCLIILINTGLKGVKFFKVWGKSWFLAYVIAVPCILIIAPQIDKLVDKIVKE